MRTGQGPLCSAPTLPRLQRGPLPPPQAEEGSQPLSARTTPSPACGGGLGWGLPSAPFASKAPAKPALLRSSVKPRCDFAECHCPRIAEPATPPQTDFYRGRHQHLAKHAGGHPLRRLSEPRHRRNRRHRAGSDIAFESGRPAACSAGPATTFARHRSCRAGACERAESSPFRRALPTLLYLSCPIAGGGGARRGS